MKKYIIGMVAIILAVAGSAFTAKKKSHALSKSPNALHYYKYNLTTTAGETTPSNYSFITPQPANDDDVEDCGGAQLPCVIHAQGSMSVPNSSEITTSNLPNVTLTQKAVQ